MTPAQVLGFLRGPTTEEFLSHYMITVAGKPGPPSAIVTYYVWQHSPNKFKVSHDPGVAGAGNVTFQAHSIYMVESNVPYNMGGLDGYVLGGGGADIMVTGMLNGCSFVMKSDAGRNNVRCAHLRPGAGANAGNDLNVRTMNNAQFHGDAGAVSVYGRLNYPDRNSTVIGVRRGGVWSIYQQQYDGLAANNIRAASQIL